MKHICGAIIALLLLVMPAWAGADDWVGSWGAHWAGGDVRIELAQHGSELVGSIPLHGGQIKGHIEGRSLVGEWSEGGWSGRFVFTLTPSGKTFLGRFDNGEWWSGGRLDKWAAMPPSDQSTPRSTIRSFLLAGDRARTGVPDAIGRAATLIEFQGWSGSLTILEQVALVQQLFNLVDMTTVNLREIPEAPFEDQVDIRLAQAGTGVFRRGDLINAGDTRGTVEHVGIRSTRIRTSEDSVLVVPNGKLADATINNMGPAGTGWPRRA